MAKNERTSARVAKIAAKILAMDLGLSRTTALYDGKYKITCGDIRALAASALTQSPDKPKRSRILKDNGGSMRK